MLKTLLSSPLHRAAFFAVLFLILGGSGIIITDVMDVPIGFLRTCGGILIFVGFLSGAAAVLDLIDGVLRILVIRD